MINKKVKGLWIPREILFDKNLSHIEKICISEINNLHSNAGCYASNKHFSEYLEVSRQHASRVICSLEKKGYIKSQLEYDGNVVEKRTIEPLKSMDTGVAPTGDTVAPTGDEVAPTGDGGVTDLHRGCHQTVEDINTSINTDINTDINTSSKSFDGSENTAIDQDKENQKKAEQEKYDHMFNALYSAGLPKRNKPQAIKAFNKLIRKQSDPKQFTAMLIDDIKQRLDDLPNYFGFEKLHLSTYLNKARWTDELQQKLPLGSEPPKTGMDGLGDDDWSQGLVPDEFENQEKDVTPQPLQLEHSNESEAEKGVRLLREQYDMEHPKTTESASQEL